MKTNYIKGFDGLRSVSILFVILTHLGVYRILYHGEFYLRRVIMLINGTTGVNIFFAISGFLITTILLKEKQSTGKINFKNFFARRFLRLLPTLLIFYLVIFILMSFEIIDKSYVGLIISFFYLYNFIPNKYYTGELGHTWSLAVEEQFYFFWPFVVNIMQRLNLLFISVIILILCVLFTKVVPFLYLPYHGKIFYINYIFNTSRWFLPAVGVIMIGASIAIFNFYKVERMLTFFNSRICLMMALFLFICPLYLPLFTFLDSTNKCNF